MNCRGIVFYSLWPKNRFENPLKGGKPNDRIYFWHGPASNYKGMLPQSERPLIRVSFQSHCDHLIIKTQTQDQCHFETFFQRSNHATIQINDLIYFIGGLEYNENGLADPDNTGTIEVWELKWDHDPAYVPSGYGACPHWCTWNDIAGMDSWTTSPRINCFTA